MATLVSPETIPNWYRRLISRKYDGSRNHGPGRPPTPEGIREIVVRMARENPRWGYTRIQGALYHLGHQIGRNTVKRILEEQGPDPAPMRRKRTFSTTFLKAHVEVMAAADFFSVEILTLRGLVRTMVFFVMEVATRRVHVAGMACDPEGAWVTQLARNLTDAESGFLMGKRMLIRDHDPLYTRAFDDVLGGAGIRSVKLPAQSQNLDAFAERWVGSIRSECLDRMIFTTEAALRRAIEGYLAHYHRERPHQGLGNDLIEARRLKQKGHGPVRC
jgi:putative transposase